MSGTTEGGRKARDKNLAKDPLFYAKIGARGGRNGNTGGFAAATPEQLREWGRRGGLKSRRVAKVPQPKERESLWTKVKKSIQN